MNCNEIWKPVVGYEGVYSVSSNGRVRRESGVDSMGRKLSSHVLKSYTDRYVGVHLCKNGKMKNLWVHRLVAEAFLPNPKGLKTVNHKDEIKTNNNVSNLEWMSQPDNNLYNGRSMRVGFKHRVPVVLLSPGGHKYTLTGSIEVANLFGFSIDKVYKCVSGKQKQVHGYKIMYK